MALGPGDQLGPYLLTTQIGQGGMGMVFAAQDPRLDRQVAIKVLPPDLTRDPTAKQRFLQEAKAASALDHPNICTIHDVGETDDGELYLVMAHYEGETLKERIARGPLPVNEAVDIATQVGRGLAKAHVAGIVHRDIKPANLMVTTDSTVKILDFGLAKLAGLEGVTQTGTTVGTVAYMSPEQARGQEVDHRTDIWSLGVVLYEMLAGEPPFQGENLLALAEAIRSQEPGRLGADAESLDPVIRKALNKESGQRYEAVADLVADLRSPSGSGAARSVAETQAEVPSIAVLPFANMSTDPDQQYFCDGLAEDLITELSRLRWLHVTARNSSFSYRAQTPDIRDVARDLGVGYIVEGSVRKGANRVRITAQLIDTSTGNHIWSEKYDRDLDEIFALQDEITETLASTLETEVGEFERERAHRQPPDSLGAWDAYQRGLWHMWQMDSQDLTDAQHFLGRAIELDPTFAQAHAAMAFVHFLEATMTGVGSSLESLARASQFAAKAIALDEKEAMAHAVLGRILTFQGDFDAAIQESRIAIALSPSSALGHYGLGVALWWRHQSADAIPELDMAVRLSPRGPFVWATIHMRAYARMCLGEYDLATEDARQAILHPTASFWPYATLAAAEGLRDRAEEAKQALDKLLDINPEFSPDAAIARYFPAMVEEMRPKFESWIEGLRKAGLDVASSPPTTGP